MLVTHGLAEASPGGALKQQWFWHFCSWTESTSVFPCSNFIFSIRLLTSNITCGKDCEAAAVQSASLPKVGYKFQVREEHAKSSHSLGYKRARAATEDLPRLASASSLRMSGLKQFLGYFSCCFCNSLLDLLPSLPCKLRGLLQNCQHMLAGRRQKLGALVRRRATRFSCHTSCQPALSQTKLQS